MNVLTVTISDIIIIIVLDLHLCGAHQNQPNNNNQLLSTYYFVSKKSTVNPLFLLILPLCNDNFSVAMYAGEVEATSAIHLPLYHCHHQCASSSTVVTTCPIIP